MGVGTAGGAVSGRSAAGWVLAVGQALGGWVGARGQRALGGWAGARGQRAEKHKRRMVHGTGDERGAAAQAAHAARGL